MTHSRKLLLGILAAWCAGMPGAPAFAFDQAALGRVVADRAEQSHVLDTARRSSVFLHNPCRSARFELSKTVGIYHPPTFDGAGAPTSGAWRQGVREEGCGAHRLLNVLAFVKGPKTLVLAPLLPGTTHADPLLQRDGVHYAVLAAGIPEKNCSIGYVADTQFQQSETPPATGGIGAPWKELWTLVSCARTVQISMRFIPDSTGTQIVAERAPVLPSSAKP
jgi:hypothetical protein